MLRIYLSVLSQQSLSKVPGAVESIVRQFCLPDDFEVVPFGERGNIHQEAYLVCSGGTRFLLQKINESVFAFPDRLIAGMKAAIEAQLRAFEVGAAPSGWEVVRLIETKQGQDCVSTPDGVWRMMSFIEGASSFRSLSELDPGRRQEVAREAGRGLAIFTDMMASIDPRGLEPSLPGYRDTNLYYRMFRAVLDETRSLDDVDGALPSQQQTREATEQLFLVALDHREYTERRADAEVERAIRLLIDRRELASSLASKLREGEIRGTVIHGDPKLENFLFHAGSLDVRALIDLDTIMPLTWLADWGDMARSIVNVAGEKADDLGQVRVDEDAYAALRLGFLESCMTAPSNEIHLMHTAAEVMTLEQAVRFLTDYLRGDIYYALGPEDPPDLNRRRALVQVRLYEELAAVGSK